MNQKGFVTISIITVLPLLLIVSFGCLWLIWFLNEKHKLENICHEAVLASQEALVKSNDRLLRLNPIAQVLITEKKALDLVILTGPPPAKVAAIAKRKLVVLKQKALQATQKAIILTGNGHSRLALAYVPANFQSQVSQIREFWKSEVPSFAKIDVSWKPSQIKIKVKDIASVYQRAKSHPQDQKHFVQWQVPMSELFPEWIKKLITIHNTWSGHCTSHPNQGGLQWYPQIGKVRP